MESSWNDQGSGQGCSYTPCIEIFDEQSQEFTTQEAEVMPNYFVHFKSCFICQPSSVYVQGSFATPQVEVAAPQVDGAGAPQVGVSGPSRRVKTMKKVPRREKNYSIQEDEMLCSAYINVSKDPITGCNQPMGAYWDRVWEYYQAHKKMQSERTKCSLQHRWKKIQRDTSKFCGYHDSIERLNESGKNEDDRVSKFYMF
jgi:hypothetical protein